MGRKKPRRPRGRPAHEPTDAIRKQVESMSAVGIPQESIAKVLDIAVAVLTKYYRAELDTAVAKANAQMAGALFRNGMGGNVAAQIFWMKTRARWSEHTAPVEQDEPLTVFRRSDVPPRLQLVKSDDEKKNGTDGE